MKPTRPAGALAAVISILMLAACGQSDPPASAAAPPPPAVTVATPLEQRITEWDEFTGRFEAVETVEVRARVSGYLTSINFRDGQTVEKDDLLFVIDPRPFEIAVAQAKAEVVQSEVNLELARSEVKRARSLAERRNISEQEVEEQIARAREQESVLTAARARLRDAELQLEWTQVKAAVSGRISSNRVDVGNLVTGGTADATLLTTIVALDPIHFVFEGSETDYLKYTRLAEARRRPSSRDTGNPVRVRLIDEDEFVHKGEMNFVDNVMDAQTGTIRARAVFDNPSHFLVPGLFGRLRLFGGEFDALLIPDTAILSDQARKVVLVVDDSGTVGTRVVTLGPMSDGLRVIRSGLTAADRIIIQGLQRARPGQPVTAEEGTIAAATPPGADATTGQAQ